MFNWFIGSKWHDRRKLLSNVFHLKTLDLYTSSINKHSQVLATKLLNASVKNNGIFITEFVTLCSLDIICGNYLLIC